MIGATEAHPDQELQHSSEALQHNGESRMNPNTAP